MRISEEFNFVPFMFSQALGSITISSVIAVNIEGNPKLTLTSHIAYPWLLSHS